MLLRSNGPARPRNTSTEANPNSTLGRASWSSLRSRSCCPRVLCGSARGARVRLYAPVRGVQLSHGSVSTPGSDDSLFAVTTHSVPHPAKAIADSVRHHHTQASVLAAGSSAARALRRASRAFWVESASRLFGSSETLKSPISSSIRRSGPMSLKSPMTSYVRRS
jgi:hypothetical protein